MTAAETDRRKLEFSSFDDLLAELDRLQTAGYRRLGRWNLAQMCGHLSAWLKYPMDGYPPVPLPMRALFWVARHTGMKARFRKIIEQGQMPSGIPTTRETVPGPDEDESAAVDELRETIRRWQAHEGPMHPSPVFGPADRWSWDRLQLIHCAHHLSYLIPNA